MHQRASDLVHAATGREVTQVDRLAHGTAIATSSAPAASRTVPADSPAPRAATTEANESGPRLFEITAFRPARSAVRANAWSP